MSDEFLMKYMTRKVWLEIGWIRSTYKQKSTRNMKKHQVRIFAELCGISDISLMERWLRLQKIIGENEPPMFRSMAS